MIVKFGILLIFTVNGLNCANILFAASLSEESHYGFHETLALELVNRGHNVTVLTHQMDQDPPLKNLTIIKMTKQKEWLDLMESINSMRFFKQLKVRLTTAHYSIMSDGFLELWSYPGDFKFDLIIYSAIGRFMYALTERFHNPPSIALTPFLLPPAPLTVSFGSHPINAYEPDTNSSGFMDNMRSGYKRICNAISTYFDIFFTLYFYQPKEDALVGNLIELQSTIDELEDKISLVLCNTDPLIDYPSLPANIIAVGGMHVRPSKSLPNDLQVKMDKAKSGVILCWLGANDLSRPVIEAFLEAFSGLPQMIIWKYERALDWYSLPENVITTKQWLSSENDVMGHPNTKLLINDGGILSSQEALYHGVPIISIPFDLDQLDTAKRVLARTTGLMLDKDQFNEIGKAIDDVLYTEMYQNNAKSLSVKYRDQPFSAMERAVFWVEYVIRNGNADYLSPPTRRMPIYQIFGLDSLLYLTTMFALLIYNIVWIIFIRKWFWHSIILKDKYY